MNRIKRMAIFSFILLLILNIVGCNTIVNRINRIISREKKNDLGTESQQSEKYINPEIQVSEVNVTLYFKHYLVDHLVPEKRTAQKGKQPIEYVVVEELLKGPMQVDRVAIMPPDVKVLDVTRKGDTVFVNLSEEFTKDIDITVLPGMDKLPEEQMPYTLARMKQLSIYSIVNSLTELDGVNRVKILVNNRSLTYDEIGADLIASELPNVDINAPIMAIARKKGVILSPDDAVREVFTALNEGPDWNRVDAFLARVNSDGSERPSIEELQKTYLAYVSALEFQDGFIEGEEIKPDGEAFVTVTYAIKYANGKKESRENDIFRVVNEEGIWKVRLPGFFENVD
ncbi:MAG: GerMN domain-containing protein [Clostridiales bacterium]|jgi:spore germination protein GerM|nr:GerMN domain-containing protein [Clostridiales bacterium]